MRVGGRKMIINQNILAILLTFFQICKNFYETLYTDETTSKVPATTEILNKIPSRKKISNGHFNVSEAKISLDEIMKSINSETNESPDNDGLTAEFYKHFFNELAPASSCPFRCL